MRRNAAERCPQGSFASKISRARRLPAPKPQAKSLITFQNDQPGSTVNDIVGDHTDQSPLHHGTASDRLNDANRHALGVTRQDQGRRALQDLSQGSVSTQTQELHIGETKVRCHVRADQSAPSPKIKVGTVASSIGIWIAFKGRRRAIGDTIPEKDNLIRAHLVVETAVQLAQVIQVCSCQLNPAPPVTRT